MPKALQLVVFFTFGFVLVVQVAAEHLMDQGMPADALRANNCQGAVFRLKDDLRYALDERLHSESTAQLRRVEAVEVGAHLLDLQSSIEIGFFAETGKEPSGAGLFEAEFAVFEMQVDF